MVSWVTKVWEKLNPAQQYFDDKVTSSKERTLIYQKGYEELEVVNRGVNIIIDDCAEISTIVGEVTPGEKVVSGIKKSRVNKLLNFEPNPFQDINTFKRNLITDYIIDGNIFIYFDGVHLYHLPSMHMIIHTSEDTYIEKYTFKEIQTFKPSEIIHIKENSFDSIYRGTSRLKPAQRTMNIMRTMKAFQGKFFDNGAVLGLVIKSPNTLSEKIKARYIASWMQKYNPTGGGRRPLILDGGLEIDSISDINFRELDFQQALSDNENIVLKALGVPPIMLDSGNNANLRPNMRMYYLETILPIVRKINFGYQRYFGFLLTEDITNIPALQPELRDQSQYYTSLVNGGIITPNEARDGLGFKKDEDPASDELRIPENITGSATNPDEGGKPKEPED